MTSRIARRTGIVLLLGAMLAACTDTTSATHIANPEAATKLSAGTNNLQVVDQFSCSTTDFQTYYCNYTGTETYGYDPYQWSGDYSGHIWAGPVNCQSSPMDCRGAGGSAPPPTDKSTCLVAYDANCEQMMPDSIKAKIRASIAIFVKDPSTIADPDVADRCSLMLMTANQLLDANPPRVFIGASDTPASNPYAHYGEYSDLTTNVHFDPWAITNLSPGSDRGWQIANTMLHEAAHAMGQEHAGQQLVPYRGKSPVYNEPYFSDLNPKAGCMKT